MSEEVKKFKVTIDGQTTEVLPGTSILEAARQIGGKSVPPAMCIIANWKPVEDDAERVW